jgi:hypothetical protein
VGKVILDQLDITTEDFATGTGWTIKPEGACRDALCVPLPPDAVVDGRLSLEVAAKRLGMPLLHDEEQQVWALGPASVTGRVLNSAQVPPLTLPDVNGSLFSLESLRGQKVLLVAWASW